MESGKKFFLPAGKKQCISTAAEVFISFLAFKPGRALERGEGPAKIFFPQGVRNTREQKEAKKKTNVGLKDQNWLMTCWVSERIDVVYFVDVRELRNKEAWACIEARRCCFFKVRLLAWNNPMPQMLA